MYRHRYTVKQSALPEMLRKKKEPLLAKGAALYIFKILI